MSETTYDPTKSYSKEFDAWLAAAQVTRFDWFLTVQEVGAERAIELVEAKIEALFDDGYEEPAPEENFWDDRTTPLAYSKEDADRDLAERLEEVAKALPILDGIEEKAEAHGHPAFQDEPSAFIQGWLAKAKQIRDAAE